MKSFFGDSEVLGHLVLRPLSHLRANWELTWDVETQVYLAEDDSFADLLNQLIAELGQSCPPPRYHDNEDRLAEFVRDGHLKWPIRKVGNRWIGAHYDSILEQGAFNDVDQNELVLAAAGRIQAACRRNQQHFDNMEESHRRMLGAVLSVILFQRA